jgi:hypothetical protein
MSIRSQLRESPEQGKPIGGQDIDAPERFAPDTRHMVVYDTITEDSPAGDVGERVRVFLTDEGYGQVLESEGRGQVRIVRHARVRKGDLSYAAPEHDRAEYH